VLTGHPAIAEGTNKESPKGNGIVPLPKKPKTEVDYKMHFESKPLKKDSSVVWFHAPYLQGDCGLCHVSDNREKPGKLRTTVDKLCLDCHEPTRRELRDRKVVHKPSENCSYCHNPHNSKNRYLLHEPTQKLCTSCHLGISNIVKNSKVAHSPVMKGNTCRNCHLAHASSAPNLLEAPGSVLCLNCHGKDDIKGKNGERLPNFARLLEENHVHHKPVDDKDCSACHGAHGTNYFRLLTDNYPEDLYAKYDDTTYALCYKCHNKTAFIEEAETETATQFRDGKKNLHTVHVVNQSAGRTCRTCHGEHATKQAHLMRRDIPYGSAGWRLKINFLPTKTGGWCAKTCHETKEYKNK
jgi:predicted CXXCH cytochrome family protein